MRTTAEIFLLEDDEMLSRGIEIALKKDGHHITHRFTFREAAADLEAGTRHDLFLLDINLPDGSGLTFCEQIRSRCAAPVIFLTADDTEEDMLSGFTAGCDDYIVKPFSLEVLRRKVDVILMRTGTEPKHIIRYRDLEIDCDRACVRLRGEQLRLTATEYRLLKYLAENRGRAVSRGTLIRDIWDIREDFIDENTLSVNIRRLRKKLGDDPKNPSYIITLFGLGYTFGK